MLEKATNGQQLSGDEKIEHDRMMKDLKDEDSDIMIGRKATQCALEIKIESEKLFSQ